MAVQITNIRLIGDAYRNRTLSLSIDVLPFLTGSAKLQFSFPGKIKTLDSLTTYTIAFSADSGVVHNETFNIKVLDTVSSLIEATASILNAPTEYVNHASGHINVTYVKKDYKIFTTTTSDSGYYSLHFSRYTNLSMQKPVPGNGRMRSFNISGSVNFQDPWQSMATLGLYGTKIEMWFCNSNNPTELWNVPGYNQHQHYDIISASGSYYFNFTTTADLSQYNRIVLLVYCQNNYIEFLPSDGFIISTSQGTVYTYLDSEGAMIPYNPSIYTFTLSNEVIQINGEDGGIFRNMEIAGEAVKQRYSGNVPFSQPLVMVQKKDLSSSGHAGEFRCRAYDGFTNLIYIDPNYTDAGTTMHEFGHNVNSNMYADDYDQFNSNPSDMKEGWAIYFSFFGKNYSNAVFGDYLDYYDDNVEEASFDSPRFRFMRYHNSPSYCKFACYLWNIYDSYSDGNFKAPHYANADNDDFGSGTRPFEIMRQMNSASVSSFNQTFKNGLQTDEQNSVQKIYDNMFVSSSDRMLSPQIADGATGTEINSTNINFTWLGQSYEFYAPFKNIEDNYKLYRQTANGNPWELCATIQNYEYTYNYSYTYSNSNADKYNYELTSSNTEGNSCHPKIFHFNADPQLIVNINGPSVLYEPTPGDYSASITGGNGSNSYHWYVSYDGTSWTSKGTNSTCHFIPDWSEQSAIVRVDITSGLQQVTATKEVDIHCSGCGWMPVRTELSRNLGLHPNPTSGEVSFDYIENSNLYIYDIQDNVVKTFLNFSGNRLDLNQLQSGIYFLKFINMDGSLEKGKIIISK